MGARHGFQRESAPWHLAQRLAAGRIVHHFHRLFGILPAIHPRSARGKQIRCLHPASAPNRARTERDPDIARQEEQPPGASPVSTRSLPARPYRNQEDIGSCQCLARKSVVGFMHMGKASPLLTLRNFKRRDVALDRPDQPGQRARFSEKTIQSREENIQTLAAAPLRECYEELRVAAPLPSRPPREMRRGSSANFRTKPASSP